MNNNKSATGRLLLSGLFLAMSCHAFAQGESGVAGAVPDAPQETSTLRAEIPGAVVLSDKIHEITQTLESTSAVHQYSFTAIRGQNVLLATPGSQYDKLWKVEYQVDGGEWKRKPYAGAYKISDLNPGSQVNVRVLAVEGGVFENAEYRIVFGSFPHMNYDLLDEQGILPISAFQDKVDGFLATQAFKEVTLEATFTDSKAHPLEGGELLFSLTTGTKEEVKKPFLSDKNGKISELIEFKRCEGGWLAKSIYENVDKTRLTWSTRYEKGSYSASNILIGHLEDKVYEFKLGHLCKRWLTNLHTRP
ncbi:fibronectin type III domain-containing protein [Pseudomonas viridiflava]|uniref:fibronectin type III domain-containing protein n=1 Tax=Pseudomonas viridiflava TaxID=33069 RepID=UPI00040DB52B|nr:fibronectin type III domain-containing protein [Pseudomonas viridiflava]